MKTLYLDVCAYCRPFDNQESPRILQETVAVYLILKYIEQARYRAAVSPVHFQEIGAIQEIEERLELEALLKRLQSPFQYNPQQARKRAEMLHAQGFGVADAAHVAFAEQLADVLITCDDKLLKKCRKASLKIAVMNPLEFITHEDLQ